MSGTYDQDTKTVGYDSFVNLTSSINSIPFSLCSVLIEPPLVIVIIDIHKIKPANRIICLFLKKKYKNNKIEIKYRNNNVWPLISKRKQGCIPIIDKTINVSSTIIKGQII